MQSGVEVEALNGNGDAVEADGVLALSANHDDLCAGAVGVELVQV